ncbi:hypothetical protein ACTGXY_11325, partial [Streptococcus suis]
MLEPKSFFRVFTESGPLVALAVAIALGVLFLSLIFFLVPALTLWRSNLFYAMIIAIVLLLAVRALLGRTLGSDTFKRRIIVLGAGQRAAR